MAATRARAGERVHARAPGLHVPFGRAGSRVRLGSSGLWLASGRNAYLGFALAVFGVSAVSLLAFVDPIPHEAIASGLYLVVVVAVVAVGRLLPALVAALLSFLALAYWFSPPPGKLTPEPEDLIALVEFLLVGLLVSQLLAAGARSRERSIHHARKDIQGIDR